MKKIFLVLLALFVLCTAIASNSVQAKSDKKNKKSQEKTATSDSLPLEHGVYVHASYKGPCDNAPNAEKASYNGYGISSAHIFCKITNVRREGNTYHITQECEGDGGMGGNSEYTQRSIITILNNTSFKEGNTIYRFCEKFDT